MATRIRQPAAILMLIVASYLIVATLYAGLTPLWQVPDEPAHYNYARYLAEHAQFPVLQAGDYPHQYLEEIKRRQFPADMPIDPIRYEFHQPPLYYLLAAGIYGLTAGAASSAQVILMRLLSVLIGAGTLLTAYRIVKEIFPHRATLSLGAVAFIAFLPMHIAVTAGITNDPLAELLLALILLALVRYLKWRLAHAGAAPRKTLLTLGVLVGLGMLTKTTVYYALPAVLGGLLWGEWQGGPAKARVARSVRAAVWVFGLALLIALPWFIRNGITYGGLDVLGLGRHDAVVTGQLRTADWLSIVGRKQAMSSFVQTTFHSFWAMFGWMGVLIDGRLYLLLALFSGLLALGAALALWRVCRSPSRLSRFQWAALAALGLTAGATIAGYFWYNAQFVQHQGRYLFPALASISLLAAAGLRELLTRRGSRIAAIVLAGSLIALLIAGLLRDDLPLLWLGVLGALTAGFGLLSSVSSRVLASILTASVYAGLLALDLLCLLGFIVPYFA